jgi:hypothetical protein
VVRHAEERAEARGGVDDARPAVGETDAAQLRERLGEMLGQRREDLRVVVVPVPDGSPEVVDRVVTAPQDPPVRRERLGDQDVVVDGHDPGARPAQRTRERIGGQGHLRGPDDRPVGDRLDMVTVITK